MVPTRLTVLLLTLGLLLWLPGLLLSLVPALTPPWLPDGLVEASAGLVFAFDAGVLWLLLLDAALAARLTSAQRLLIRRDRPARLSLGVDNEIALVVENRNAVALRLSVRDLPPEGFRQEPDLLEVRVKGRARLTATYRLLPDARGNFSFGDVYLRCRGPLGLTWFQRRIRAAEGVQVYPDLLEVRRYEALVRGTLVRAGGYRTKRMPGRGREFSHFRDYTPDDDYRHVNWKATARRHKPVTAVFESEHSQDIVFCLDVGRMMSTRVGTLTKLDHAVNAVLMLAHVSQTFQDNLGLLVFSHAVHLWLPPDKGRGQQARFLQALYSVQADLTAVNYREAFSHLIARHPKRALTLVFTDLLDGVVSRDYLDAAALLRRFHLPLTLAVADVPLQRLAAREPANPRELYDVLVARDLLFQRAELLRKLERLGVAVLDTVPQRLTVDAVNRYLALKTGART
jgi:uncharacterized protein (DUF58 family)